MNKQRLVFGRKTNIPGDKTGFGIRDVYIRDSDTDRLKCIGSVSTKDHALKLMQKHGLRG